MNEENSRGFRAAERRKTMPTVTSGGCLCGHVRYEFEGPIGPANYCHCVDCRRVTGSAFNIGVRLAVTGFRLVCGEVKQFSKIAESGTRISRAFCPNCGSPLFTSSPKHPDFIYVKAGSLDDPNLVSPTHQNWIDSAVPWAHIDVDLPAFSSSRPT
jgi:hypothetical protein